MSGCPSLEERDIEFSVVSGSKEEMLFGCLESIRSSLRNAPLSWCVSVTCNTPGTGLSKRLRAEFPQARIIENVYSKGFAENHNVVMQSSRARYVWLLNDDLLILPGAIESVTHFLERPENTRVAAVSPKLLNADGSLQPSTYSFPSMPQIVLAYSGIRETRAINRIVAKLAPLMRRQVGSSRYWAHDRTVAVDTLRGACVAMRMKAVRQVGPMVEVTKVGSEEKEWHRRFRQREWKVVYFPEASVIHYGSQTVRDGSTDHYPEYLKGDLYFFRTGRPALTYRILCMTLCAMFGGRAAFEWLTRDANGHAVARRYARVAWEALTEPSLDSPG